MMKPFVLRIEEADKRALELAARRRGMPASQLARRAIEDDLESREPPWGIQVPTSTQQLLERAARSHGISVSALLGRALARYGRRRAQQAATLPRKGVTTVCAW